MDVHNYRSACSSEQAGQEIVANKTSRTPSISSAVEDGSFEYMTSVDVEQAFNQNKSEFVCSENYLLSSSCEQSGQKMENKAASEATPSSSPVEYMSTAEVEEAFDQDKSEFVCAGKSYLWSAETYERDSPQPFFWLARPDHEPATEVAVSTGSMSSSRIGNDDDDGILYTSSVEEQGLDKDKSKVVSGCVCMYVCV